jgi:hypothetical protein|tara:strand:- start:110 stop:514 length:405 start_codon:yes stop_codon:yes gene_type:complete
MISILLKDVANVIKELFDTLNNSNFFIGVMMIILNIGSKYIGEELEKSHKNFLNSKIMRRLIIFTIVFIATKDILTSLIVTAVFVILVLNLFNTNSNYCILSKSVKEIDTNNDNEISDEEIIQAYKKLQKEGKV